MANNFKNAFATSVSTTAGSPTDVYTANNGSACNSILIELDISNTGTSAVQVTVLIWFLFESGVRTEGRFKW